MLELVELVGSICFALCGLPAAYQAWKQGYAKYSWWFLILWSVGEVLMMIWAMAHGFWVILLCNYLPNFICLVIIGYYNFVSKVLDKSTDR